MLVAMSGGGKRSAAYSYGALKGMREVAVSGGHGSPFAAERALMRSQASPAGALPRLIMASTAMPLSAVTKPISFTRTPMAKSSPSTLRPWNWGWAVDSDVGTNDYMDRYYDKTMFHGARFKDLMAARPPAHRNHRHGSQLRHTVSVLPRVL